MRTIDSNDNKEANVEGLASETVVGAAVGAAVGAGVDDEEEDCKSAAAFFFPKPIGQVAPGGYLLMSGWPAGGCSRA